MSKKHSWQDFTTALKTAGLSRAEFCELAGVSYAATGSWQQNDSVPQIAIWALNSHAKARAAQMFLARSE